MSEKRGREHREWGFVEGKMVKELDKMLGKDSNNFTDASVRRLVDVQFAEVGMTATGL